MDENSIRRSARMLGRLFCICARARAHSNARRRLPRANFAVVVAEMAAAAAMTRGSAAGVNRPDETPFEARNH